MVEEMAGTPGNFPLRVASPARSPGTPQGSERGAMQTLPARAAGVMSHRRLG